MNGKYEIYRLRDKVMGADHFDQGESSLLQEMFSQRIKDFFPDLDEMNRKEFLKYHWDKYKPDSSRIGLLTLRITKGQITPFKPMEKYHMTDLTYEEVMFYVEDHEYKTHHVRTVTCEGFCIEEVVTYYDKENEE